MVRTEEMNKNYKAISVEEWVSSYPLVDGDYEIQKKGNPLIIFSLNEGSLQGKTIEFHDEEANLPKAITFSFHNKGVPEGEWIEFEY